LQDEVNDFSNNIYKGYDTLDDAQEEYWSFLADHTMAIQAMTHEPMPHQLMHRQPMFLPAMSLGEGTPHVRESAVKYFIIVVPIVVIVKFLFL
jgi:hypothetical protein